MVQSPSETATGIAKQVRSGERSVESVVETYLDRIEERDADINAYVTTTEELARETARDADEALASGDDNGPLHGVPIAIKDLLHMREGLPHTFGSKMFADADFVAHRTSVSVERLEAAGAVIVGKTNTPEFGHKGMTDNQVVGATANPFDTSLNAGGSSGGSAAVVASGMAPVAMGSDIGGSIRIPAALCGVFGFKPSFGVIPIDSRPNAFGGESLNAAKGPLTRTVEDAAIMLDVLAGSHPADPNSVPVDIDFTGALDRSIDDLRVAYSPNLDIFEVTEPVARTVEDALDAFETAGVPVETVSIDHGSTGDELFESFLTMFSTEVAGNAAVLDAAFGINLREHAEDVSDTLLKVLDIADDQSIADVAATGLQRTQLFDGIRSQLADYDLLITPTLGSVEVDLHQSYDDHLEWARTSMLTWPFNITGHPASTVPAGTTDDGLPVGLQIVGRRYEDETVLAASAALERERPWHEIYPY